MSAISLPELWVPRRLRKPRRKPFAGVREWMSHMGYKSGHIIRTHTTTPYHMASCSTIICQICSGTVPGHFSVTFSGVTLCLNTCIAGTIKVTSLSLSGTFTLSPGYRDSNTCTYYCALSGSYEYSTDGTCATFVDTCNDGWINLVIQSSGLVTLQAFLGQGGNADTLPPIAQGDCDLCDDGTGTNPAYNTMVSAFVALSSYTSSCDITFSFTNLQTTCKQCLDTDTDCLHCAASNWTCGHGGTATAVPA